MKDWVAITGCNGYIGGQMVLNFKDAEYRIIGVDLEMKAPWLHDYIDVLVHDDCSSDCFVEAVAERNPVALIHLAGTSLVGPSIANPLPYYANNVGNTALMLQKLAALGWNRRVFFSSTAAVYKPSDMLLTESCALQPSNPYGQSKLFAETVLRDAAHAYGFDVAVFRYFNACGADSRRRHGQEENATHIMARIMHAHNTESEFVLYGNDYDTPDGTCVRDYLHVEDITSAHLYALDEPEIHYDFKVYNLGTGVGTSNLEVIAKAEKVLRMKLNVVVEPRRAGDAPRLVASAHQFKEATNWHPISKMPHIIQTAFDWHYSCKIRRDINNQNELDRLY